MITYLLNFVLCSGLLLMVYRAFLGNEKLYKFNRFYLLFSLVFSLAVPLITIKVLPKQIPLFTSQVISPPVSPVITPDYQQVVTQPVSPIVKGPVYQQLTTQPVAPIFNAPVQQQILQTPAPNYNYLPLLIAIYLIIAIGLLLRFTKNLYQINRSVAKNAVRAADGTKLILVDEEVTPHSFLNYVFINKKDYRDGSIEPEIICHEQAHVQQLHSLDVIFVELLQVICWFNPVIPFYRRAIQLNHEFLADEAVIKSYDDTPAYQHLLLTKAGQCGSLYLTSQFNYLTTKKRLIMMTKTTSAKIALYKQLAILPVLAAVVLLFSNKVIAQSTPVANKVGNKTAMDQDLSGNAPIKVVFDGKPTPFAKDDASQGVLDQFAAILKKYGIPAGPDNHLHMSPKIAPDDNVKLERLYAQMSKMQQNNQWVQFRQSSPPLSKSHPTEKQLATWQDAINYGVRIDDKRIKNAELAKYKPSDFDLFFFSNLTPLAVKNDGFHYQIDLMTPAAYSKFHKEMLSKKDWQMYIKSKKAVANTKVEKTEDPANTESADAPQQTPQQNKTGAANNAGLESFGIDGEIAPPAKSGAPQKVLDEYATILKKTKQTITDNSQSVGLSRNDQKRIATLYALMSSAQQKDRFLLLVSHKPSPAIAHPTSQQFADWGNAAKYDILIDGKRIKNVDLASYKPSDFDYNFHELRMRSNANAPFKTQVQLLTPAGYIAFLTDSKARGNIWLVWRKMNVATAAIKQEKNEHSKGIAPPDFVIVTKTIPPAKQDAPQKVMDEYAELTKKNNVQPPLPGHQLMIDFNVGGDRRRMADLYNQMSKKQQGQQVIKFGPIMMPSPKRSPSDQQLKDWQDRSLYRVWIDGKKIDQAELAKYRPADFALFNIGRLSATTNPNYKKYHFEVRLMTPGYYDNYSRKTLTDKTQSPVFTSLLKKAE